LLSDRGKDTELPPRYQGVMVAAPSPAQADD
jgi:hypothetical protein